LSSSDCAGVGIRSRRRRGAVSAVVLCAVATGVAGCGSGGGKSENASPAADATYGSLPSFLPSQKGPADNVLTGSPGNPAVTSEGDTVRAMVGTGSVQISVLGPVVPGEGLPKVTAATTCTWTVTLQHATTTIPLRTSDFVALDQDRDAYHPQPVPDQPKPPSSVHPGDRVQFQLRVVMPTGEGVMRWAPVAGQVLGIWDFVTEND
jgi:hypothetical protein